MVGMWMLTIAKGEKASRICQLNGNTLAGLQGAWQDELIGLVIKGLEVRLKTVLTDCMPWPSHSSSS